MATVRSFLCSSLALVSCLVIGCHASLYTDQDVNIQQLTPEIMEGTVKNSNSIWMIQLYDPEQKESKDIAQEYKGLAHLMKGVFPLAVVDVSTYPDVAAEIAKSKKAKPSQTPSFYILNDNKNNPVKVGGRGKTTPDIKMLAEALMEQVSQTVTERARTMGISQGGTTGSSSSGSGRSKSGKSHVLKLTSQNFEEKVLQNPDVIAVAFTAPWCGHCKKLEPEWEEAAERLVNTGAVLGWVDATAETDLARQFSVQGYPTIKIFPGGVNKNPKDAEDYKYERSASAIVQWMLREVDKTGAPPTIPELTESSVLDEQCGGRNRICVLAALPHILDSGAAGREKYIETVGAVAKQFRGTAFSFVWFEYTSQPELEQTLELTFGAPAVVALSVERKAYAVYHGSFKEKGMTGFLHSITTGRQKTVPLRNDQVPSVVKVEPWDGKDGQPIEEEIPLSEIMGDEF